MSDTGIRDLTLFFCEAAESRGDGKLDAHGIYNELYAPGFPAKQDRIVLAGIIEWARELEGEQTFTVHLADPDGKPVFSIEGRTPLDRRPPERAPARTHLAFPMEELVFVRPGEYAVFFEYSGQRTRGPTLHLLLSADHP